MKAFVRAYAAWGRWRPDAPAEAWVMRIAVNAAISQARRQKLREVGEIIRRLGRPQLDGDPTDHGGALLPAMSVLKPADRAKILGLNAARLLKIKAPGKAGSAKPGRARGRR